VCVAERGQDLAAKDLRERAHGKQEVLAGRDPAGAIRGQGTAGHHAVQVDVLAEILSPGVEDRRDAELSTEVAGIAREGLERVDGALE
jgi:hypothetical protein